MCAKPLNAQENNSNSPERNPCAQYDRIPKLRLRSSFGKLKYDFQHSSSQLKQMSSKKSRVLESGTFMSGLSFVDIDWSVTMSVITKTTPDCKCVVPAAVDVFIGYRNPIIYISKDVQDDKCIYNVVMRHEQQHQQINVAVLEYYLPFLKKGFEEKLSILKARPLKAGTKVDNIMDDLNFEYAEAIRPIINRFEITLQLEQQNLDTRENYESESNICK
ncbi:MAG: hypothetical protein J6T72_04180 [Alphaproteobacteria bacterium]|nr:hypothetical protein [Alphaproteobacteria bacterium]